MAKRRDKSNRGAAGSARAARTRTAKKPAGKKRAGCRGRNPLRYARRKRADGRFDIVDTQTGAVVRVVKHKAAALQVVMSLNARAAVRRRNPGEEALELYEEFHGRPADGFSTVKQREHVHTHLAKLGKLGYLKVRFRNGKVLQLDGFKGVIVTGTEDRGQIYFTGGDQSAPFAQLLDDGFLEGVQLPKDHIVLGELEELGYDTRKSFHNFRKILYWHRMGEKGGIPPLLMYDVRSELLYLADGSYQIHPEGIVH